VTEQWAYGLITVDFSQFVMVGNGQIGTQPTSGVATLPISSVYVKPTVTSSSSAGPSSTSNTSSNNNSKSSAASSRVASSSLGLVLTLLGVAGGMMVLA
jgi:hypothetical protein